MVSVACRILIIRETEYLTVIFIVIVECGIFHLVKMWKFNMLDISFSFIFHFHQNIQLIRNCVKTDFLFVSILFNFYPFYYPVKNPISRIHIAKLAKLLKPWANFCSNCVGLDLYSQGTTPLAPSSVLAFPA